MASASASAKPGSEFAGTDRPFERARGRPVMAGPPSKLSEEEVCSPGAVTQARLRPADPGRASAPLCLLTGLASVVVSFFLSTYYNIINAWAFWYLFHSFQVSRPRLEREPPPGGSLGRAGGWGGGEAEHPTPSRAWPPRAPATVCVSACVWVHVSGVQVSGFPWVLSERCDPPTPTPRKILSASPGECMERANGEGFHQPSKTGGGLPSPLIHPPTPSLLWSLVLPAFRLQAEPPLFPADQSSPRRTTGPPVTQ